VADIILVTGGARSGKSSFALQLAETFAGRKAYIATSPVIDSELEERVKRHRREREGRGWHTFEEQSELAALIEERADFDVLLVDCLTLWVNNLMYLYGERASEDLIAEKCASLLAACRTHGGKILFVTNEVGMGIVPENDIARRYRDLIGRCNQMIASEAATVFLVSCGIPMQIKGENSNGFA
jgi:adenosylcobinamide kinase/adenosylcobinamide-phosphate guanylyltransferase